MINYSCVAENYVLLQPCFIFRGEQFENDEEFKQAKSMLLDLFRGQVVTGLNLMVSTPHPKPLSSPQARRSIGMCPYGHGSLQPLMTAGNRPRRLLDRT